MKNKMLVIFSCCLLLSFCAAGAPLYAKTAKTPADGKLEDVVIKEKDAFKIEKVKPPVTLSVDHMKAVLPTVKTEKYFLDGQADVPETEDLNIPFTLDTRESISPWLHSVISQPTVEFVFDTKNTDFISWKLIITDSRGKLFNEYSDKSPLPPSISWDGRDKSGHFMLAGMVFSYIFEVIDKLGNKNTVIGKPFAINAVAHQEPEGLFIDLSLKTLFEMKKNGLEISRDGNLLLKEVSDIIKGYFDSSIIIKVNSGNKQLALNEAKMIYSYFTDNLLIPKNLITIEGQGDIPENYRAEIILMNRKRLRGLRYKDSLHNKLVIMVETPAGNHSNINEPPVPVK